MVSAVLRKCASIRGREEIRFLEVFFNQSPVGSEITDSVPVGYEVTDSVPVGYEVTDSAPVGYEVTDSVPVGYESLTR